MTMENKAKSSTLIWWVLFIVCTPLFIYLAMEQGFSCVYLLPFYSYFLVKACDII